MPVFPRIDVVTFFPGDGRDRRWSIVVTGPDDGIVRKLYQAADGLPQGEAVATVKIGAAAIAEEKGVDCKQGSLPW